MTKLCLIFNKLPLYRYEIYRLIDRTYDCDWYYGKSLTSVKLMDPNSLKNACMFNSIRFFGSLEWKKGVIPLLFKKEYKTFFMIHETRCISDWLFVLLQVLFFPSKQIYIWGHGWYGKETNFERIVKRWLFKKVTGSFVYSNYAKALMIKQGIPDNRIFVIHNSLSYSEQIKLRSLGLKSDIYSDHFGNNYPILLFIGRLTPVKRLDMLIDALASLKTDGNQFNLVFVGDGTEIAFLKERANRKCVSNQIWFYGECYDEKTNAELIYNADLCVAPGNIGLTAIHSMVFGTPCLTHNDYKWQMPEFETIQEWKTGLFFERNNVNSMVNAIKKWFTIKGNQRDVVRQDCYNEIDTGWTPVYQINLIKNTIK